MDPGRPLLATSLAGLLAAVALAVAGAAGLPGPWGEVRWWAAHAAIALVACVLPGLAFLHLHLVAPRTGRSVPRVQAAVVALQYALAALILAGAGLVPPTRPAQAAGVAGLLVLFLAAWSQFRLVRRLLPKRGASVTDVELDPLSKGDDACLKHVKVAHVFLLLGVLALAFHSALRVALMGGGAGTLALSDWLAFDQWGGRLLPAGLHLLLAGYGLLSTYGLSHLAVPRLSGVPAIAAGAIKGELHASLLGLTLLTAGFLADVRGLVIAGGCFLFLGAFTFMGVLGANIMKNKSRTQRVTPEFNYVPWTFAGVFWLVAGVLLGVFLNAIPDLLEDREPAMRFAHSHAVLAGAFVQLLLGFLHRLLPASTGVAPSVTVAGRMGFQAYNAGLLVAVAAALRDGGFAGTGFLVGALLVGIGAAASFMSLAAYARRPVTA